MSDPKRPDFMPEVRQFSQADSRIVQRPEGLGGPGDESVNRTDLPAGSGIVKYAEIQASPGGWWENHLATLSPLASVGGMVLLCDSPLGFPAHSVLVDNYTNQWLEIDGVRRAIPPYTGGWVLNAVSGTQQARVRLKAPAAFTQPVALVSEYVWVGFAEATLPPMTGLTTLAGAVGVSNVRIQDGASSNLETVSGAGGGGDGLGPNTSLFTLAFMNLFNGSNFDRARSASAANLAAQSGLGVTLTAPPGMWSIVHTPAAGAQATITRAAGAAGVRHVAWGIIISFGAIAVVVATQLQWNLRDGASGAGTILASGQVAAQAAASPTVMIPLTGLNIPGTAATAMTLEFSAALAAFIEGVTLLGYDAS